MWSEDRAEINPDLSDFHVSVFSSIVAFPVIQDPGLILVIVTLKATENDASGLRPHFSNLQLPCVCGVVPGPSEQQFSVSRSGDGA